MPVFIVLLLLLYLTPVHALEWYQSEATHDTVERLLNAINQSDITSIALCENYGCKKQVNLRLTQKELESLANLFNDARYSAQNERRALSKAIAYLEQIAGTQSQIHRDKGQNYNDPQTTGSLDCIAETINTYNWLRIIASRNLLQWHRLDKPVYRKGTWSSQHWAVRIFEHNTNRAFIVDSWYQDNGFPAIILTQENWNKS